MLKKMLMISGVAVLSSNVFAVRGITFTNNSNQPVQALCSFSGSNFTWQTVNAGGGILECDVTNPDQSVNASFEFQNNSNVYLQLDCGAIGVLSPVLVHHYVDFPANSVGNCNSNYLLANQITVNNP